MNLAIRTLCQASTGTLSSEGVEALQASGGQLVDIRSPADFRRDAMSGAVNLPVDALSHDFGQLDKQEPVILYGNSENVMCSRAARLLAGKGFRRIYHFSE